MGINLHELWMSRGNSIDAERKYPGIGSVIQIFTDKQKDRPWSSMESGKLPAEIQQRGLNKLAMLDQSVVLNDVRIPASNRIEALKGDRKGKFRIRINLKTAVDQRIIQ